MSEKFEAIDPNFSTKKADENGVVWSKPDDAAFSQYGVFFDERKNCYLRIPDAVAKEVGGPIYDYLNNNTSGGRLRFFTDAPSVSMHAEILRMPGKIRHMPDSGSASFVLYADFADGTCRYCGLFFIEPNRDVIDARVDILPIFRGRDDLVGYTVWFPLYAGVRDLRIGIPAGNRLLPHKGHYRPGKLLFYGSSITQGGCASRPGNDYAAILSREFNIDYQNCGFSGSAKGEPAMRDYLATLDASIFVLDYDHNADNPAHLAATHEPIYRAYRKAHPRVPIILVTRPDVDWDPADAQRGIVYETYQKALAEGDTLVRFVDGRTLFEGSGRSDCTVDGCHPTDLGFRRMADKIGPVLAEFLK